MRRFVEGIDRGQATLFPECLEDWIDQDTPVRAIDAFVGKLVAVNVKASAARTDDMKAGQ